VYEPPSYDFPEDDEDEEESPAPAASGATEPVQQVEDASPNGMVTSDAESETAAPETEPAPVVAPEEEPGS